MQADPPKQTLILSDDRYIADVWLSDDGLLSFHTKPGTVITLEAAKCLLEGTLSKVRGPLPSLVLMQQVIRVDRDARAYFASEDYMQLSSETALVVDSPISRVIGNFFLGINRPRYPVRLFSDPESAAAWLRSCRR